MVFRPMCRLVWTGLGVKTITDCWFWTETPCPVITWSIQGCIPVGCVPPACYPYLPACTAPGGYLPWGGVPGPGGGVVYLVPGGVYLVWGVYLVPGGTSPGTPPPPPTGQNSWHMPLKILPCPKLRLWVLTRIHSSRMRATRSLPYGGRGGSLSGGCSRRWWWCHSCCP